MVRLSNSIEQSIKEANTRLVHQCALRAKEDADVFELWFDPNRNEETTEILALLKRIEKRYLVRYIDATRTSLKERKRFYEDVILQPWEERRRGYTVAYLIRVTPGSPPDYDFGIRRLCLVVYGNNRVIDVYPHQEKVYVPSAELARKAKPEIKLTVEVLDFLGEMTRSLER